MKNEKKSKNTGGFLKGLIIGGTAGVAGCGYLYKKVNQSGLLKSEIASILKEVWGDLHNACYGDTTVSGNSESAASENRPDNDDIIDI